MPLRLWGKQNKPPAVGGRTNPSPPWEAEQTPPRRGRQNNPSPFGGGQGGGAMHLIGCFVSFS